MRRVGYGLALALSLAPAAFAATGPCTETTEITTPGYTTLSDRPARLCGVTLFATGSNAYCNVFDSPTAVPTHALSRVLAEPGSSGSGNSDQVWFGDYGYQTRYGLAAYVVNGRCVIHFGTSP